MHAGVAVASLLHFAVVGAHTVLVPADHAVFELLQETSEVVNN